ncbi:hypothetical protein ACS5NO_10770 [Larkinella sp. GY13]|uniref:hypothetical protein n=1 Tax=Larkinella sp. GY13 TaxID=3453720 RepID=UPI003EEFE9DD
MESVGVTGIDPWFILDDEPLVKDLYYFDRIVYTMTAKSALEEFCNTTSSGKKKFKEKIKEIEKLEKAGFLSEYKKDSFIVDKTKYGDEHSKDYTFQALELALNFEINSASFEEDFLDFLTRFREFDQLNARAFSIMLNRKNQSSYTPIIRSSYYNLPIGDPTLTSTVLSVLLKKFPIATADVDLEKFIEFKSDSDTQLKLARLKEWVLEISKKNYNEKEIEQKVDYLLREYVNLLKIHRLKYDLGTIESIVTVSLDVIENIVKINFSKAAKALFDFAKQDIMLLEAEQKMIGRELAYIHKLHENKNLL